MVDVVTSHDRVGMVLYPHTSQGIPADLIVLIHSLRTQYNVINTNIETNTVSSEHK